MGRDGEEQRDDQCEIENQLYVQHAIQQCINEIMLAINVGICMVGSAVGKGKTKGTIVARKVNWTGCIRQRNS